MRLRSPPPNHFFSVLLLLLLSRPSWPKKLRGQEVSRRAQAAPAPAVVPLTGRGGSSLPLNASNRILNLTAVEYAMFESINTYRLDRNLPEVCINRKLQAAARDTVDRALECDDHAQNVQRLCDGSTAADRVTEAGYPLQYDSYIDALILYMAGCKQGPDGCGRKAIRNWYNGGGTQDTLLDEGAVHLGISGDQGQGGSWFYSLFYGSSSGQKCVHVQAETPPEDGGGTGTGPNHKRRRQLLMAVEEEE